MKAQILKVVQSLPGTVDENGNEFKCKETINPQIFKHNFKDQFEYIDNISVKSQANFQCPKCREYFYKNQLQANFNCLNKSCQARICVKCDDLQHEGNCNNNHVKNRILEWQEDPKDAEEGKPFRIRFCPNPECGIPYAKTNGCEHFVCGKCKLEWCFDCSYYRSPSLKHDNFRYHRLGCALRSKVLDENEPILKNKYVESCTECSKLPNQDKACELPSSYEDFINNIYEKYNIGDENIEDLQIKLKIGSHSKLDEYKKRIDELQQLSSKE